MKRAPGDKAVKKINNTKTWHLYQDQKWMMQMMQIDAASSIG